MGMNPFSQKYDIWSKILYASQTHTKEEKEYMMSIVRERLMTREVLPHPISRNLDESLTDTPYGENE